MHERLERFLNIDGQLKQWPSKRKDQVMVIEYLATSFEPNTSYTELEINEILKQNHTFEDWALLRRELYDLGYLERTRDGGRYQLAGKTIDE